jgi:aminopeptidase N
MSSRTLTTTVAFLAALWPIAGISYGGLLERPADRPATRAEILRGGLSPLRTCYDVISYHIDVRIDPFTKTIRGSNTIGFKATVDFDKLQVDLFTNLDISSILLDGDIEAKFTREFNAVFVQLPSEVLKDSTHRLTISYGGSPWVAQRPPWDGGVTWDHDALGNPWACVTCEGLGASVWWPNKDHPTAKPSDVTISVTVPPGLEDVSNGRLLSTNVLADGWTQYNWHVSYPINNYNVTFNIGKFAHFSDTYKSAGQPLTLDYYVMPQNLQKAKRQFTDVRRMLSSYERYFGPYPFARDGYKLIESPHAGMEHQSAVAYGNHWLKGYGGNASSAVGLKFDFIIIHESAHEWWGNSVSCKDMADMWIHESFGSYAESLFVEDHYGRAAALNYINAKKPGVRNDRPMIGQYGLNREGSGDMYNKGQLVLNTLRWVIDDDPRWFSILRGIQQRFRYQSVTAEDIFGYIRKHAGKDLTGFFEQYYLHTNIPRLVVNTEKKGNAVTARYRWEVDVPEFRMPVKVTTAPGRYRFITPTTHWQTLELHGLLPENFKIADDRFFVALKLHWSYRDPEQPPAH